MPRQALADPLASLNIEGGEQCGRAVALVVVRHCRGAPLRGRPGCVRSSAWIWLFSSTDSTTALFGGLRESPTDVNDFSANSGSFDSLKERIKCDLSPCSFHTRCTVVFPTPSSAASMRALQWVAFAGFSSAVRHDLEPHCLAD